MIIDPYTWHRVTIETITRLTDDTVAVGFARPAGYHFRAGQYTVVRVTTDTGKQYVRQYSFSSSPEEKTAELLVQREPGGSVSRWFYDDAKPGDSIEISQPLGSFTLEYAKGRPAVLIAGRIGIAPYISMLREKTHPDVRLIYSVRNESQILLPALLDSFDTTYVITETSPRINRDFLRDKLSDGPMCYLCGSKQFVDSLSEVLLQLGVRPSDIKRELFTLQ